MDGLSRELVRVVIVAIGWQRAFTEYVTAQTWDQSKVDEMRERLEDAEWKLNGAVSRFKTKTFNKKLGG